MELHSVLCRSLDGRGFGFIYMYGWVSSLLTWNYHNIFIRLYPIIDYDPDNHDGVITHLGQTSWNV